MKVADLITDIRYGFTGSAVQVRNRIGFIRVTDIDENGCVDYSKVPGVSITEKEAERYLLQKGDCIIARSGSVGKAHIYSGEKTKDVFASYLIRLRFDKKKINPKYFGAFTRSEIYWKQIESNKQGGVQQNINTNGLSRIEVPLPDLKTQQKIASILEQADAARQKRKQANKLTEQFLQSAFLEMFGDPVRNEKGWGFRTIEDFVKKEKYALKRGPFGGALKKEIFALSGYLVYEQYHALNNDFAFARYYINEKKFQELKAFEVKEGDIIVSCSGVYLGKLAIIPKGAKKGIINQALLKISLDEQKIKNQFFVFLFSHPSFKNRFYGNISGTGIPNFPSMEEFKKFQFIYPSLPLQLKFASLVEQVEQLRVKQRESEKELENLFGSLMQRYFG